MADLWSAILHEVNPAFSLDPALGIIRGKRSAI